MVEPTKEQLQQLKDCELELFKAFIEVCEKLSLRYYVLAGTLLGAVRHQGFIPWDDDIDVGMPRKDYDLFMEKGQALLPDYYFVQNHITDPEYPCNFAKLRDSRTTFIEYSIRRFKVNHGVYIDIFPIDGYPHDSMQQKRLNLKRKIMKYRFRAEMEVPPISKHHPLIEAGLNVVSTLTKLIYPNFKKLILKKEQLFTSFETEQNCINYSSVYDLKEVMPREWFGEGTNLTFEGLTVLAPKEYEKWLTQIYGDYMQLPPVEKRIAHHFAECIDLDKPYTAYTNN